MVIANKAAKSIFEQMKNGDPHAGRLTTMPYAGNLFVIYSENCAPASGYVRQDGDARDTNSRDILRLLGALASEVCKDELSRSQFARIPKAPIFQAPLIVRIR